jgi:DNA-binding response OmpR family regulator
MAATRRTPGCSERCQDETVMLPGMRLETRTFHHPESHEHYGIVVARGREVTSVRTGPLLIDTRTMAVTVDGSPVTVPYREWQILELLAFNVGTVVKREVMLETLFPGERLHFGRVRTVLNRLRERLGDAGRLIVTVSGIGVMLAEQRASTAGQEGGQ